MRWRPVVFAATVGLVVAAWAAPALAKGPDQATITGPGLDAPIVVTGWGEPGSNGDLGGLADGSGLFVVMFSPAGSDPQLHPEPPTGELGAKYEISYRVPDGTPTGSTVRQDLYPQASGGPVTYTESGQVAFGGATAGGWFRAPRTFTAVLQTLGLPTTPVTAPQAAPAAVQSPDEALSATTPWIAGGLAAVLLLAAILFGLRRAQARRASTNQRY
jgi:hypothetical protein